MQSTVLSESIQSPGLLPHFPHAKYNDILDENLLQSAQDEGSPSNRTTTLSTQPRQRRSGYGTTLNVLE
jgi:hypothetical protein